MNWKTKLHTDKMDSGRRLSRDFYTRDVLEVAPELPGKYMVVRLKDGTTSRYKVTEVEAYRVAKTKHVMLLREEPPELR